MQRPAPTRRFPSPVLARTGSAFSGGASRNAWGPTFAYFFVTFTRVVQFLRASAWPCACVCVCSCPCCVLPCRAVPCRAVPCCAVLCCAVLCLCVCSPACGRAVGPVRAALPANEVYMSLRLCAGVFVCVCVCVCVCVHMCVCVRVRLMSFCA